MARLGRSWFGKSSFARRSLRRKLRRPESAPFGRAAEVLEERTLLAAATGDLSTTATTQADVTAGDPLLTLQLKPLNLDLLGLHVTSDPITVTVSAGSGDGKLLGNLLGSATSLVNLGNVSTALNQVLGATVDLLNSVDLQVAGVGSGIFSTHAAATTGVLDLYVAPVQLDLMGAVVQTSPVHLNITAEAGDGLVLGNVLTDLANLFNPPLPDQLDVATINTKLDQLLGDLNAQIPNIPPAPTEPTKPFASGDVLSLTVPQIDLDLLGLNLQTTPITVDAHATSGDGLLLGNVLTSVLNTLDATPEQLHDLSANLNDLLAKVVGVLNSSTLTLPAGAVDSLSDTLQILALPGLVTAAPGASTPVLDLVVHSSDGSTPPVAVDLLGVKVTTSDIDAVLSAKTGDGEVLGNLVYNVANLLNPGGTAGLFGLIADLAAGTSSGTTGTGLDPTTGSTGPVKQVLKLDLPPINLDLLGLEVDTSQITVTVSSQQGDGKLLGNAVGGLATLLNTEAVSAAVNNVLGSVVTLVNSASADVAGVLDGTFTASPTSSDTAAAANLTPVLNLFVAPVHLDLLGVIVDTGPITLTVRARAGAGLVLGNVLTAISDLFNPPLPDHLDLDLINNKLQSLLQELQDQLPGITPAVVPPPVITDNRIVSLTLPALDLNLLGLKLATQPITVNSDAATGDGLLLGNVLQTVLNTLGATPTQLSELSANLNGLLGEVFGLLNATDLTLPVAALESLTGPLGTLVQPDLIAAAPGATTTILDLSIASTDGTTPPVKLDALGLTVTTSDIDAVLSAVTGDGQVLGNLLYNIANLLNSGSPAALLDVLGQLSTPVRSATSDLFGFLDGGWFVGTSTGSAFTTTQWAQWNPNAAWDALLHADVSGDGRPDVIGLLDGQWWVGVSNGTGFTTSRWAGWANVAWKDATAADLDGDGKADLLARVGGNWWAALSTGTGLAVPKLWAGWADAAWDHFFLTDLTGDGKADLLGEIDGQWWAAASTGTAFGTKSRWAAWSNVAWEALGIGDFDGDGRQDVYGLIRGAWFVGRNTGSAFATSLRAAWAPGTWRDAAVGDFNGDGRDDLAARYRGQWWVGRSDAYGGQAAVTHWASWADVDWKDIQVGDFDGDGNDDLVGRYLGAWYVARSTGTVFLTDLWARWADLGWRAVAAGDATGLAQTGSGGGSLRAAPTGTGIAAASKPPALRLSETVAPVAKRDDKLQTFWAQSARDDAFADRLLAGA
jgi:hypothetical protein